MDSPSSLQPSLNRTSSAGGGSIPSLLKTAGLGAYAKSLSKNRDAWASYKSLPELLVADEVDLEKLVKELGMTFEDNRVFLRLLEKERQGFAGWKPQGDFVNEDGTRVDGSNCVLINIPKPLWISELRQRDIDPTRSGAERPSAELFADHGMIQA